MLMPSIFNDNFFDNNFFDSWFDMPSEADFFGGSNPLYGKHAKNMMKTDIKENENGYELDIDLPGFKKDELSVSLKDGYLTIQAAKGLDKDEKDDKDNYIRRERYAGSMQRSYYIGKQYAENDIHASYEDGILRLALPKLEAVQAQEQKLIEIK